LRETDAEATVIKFSIFASERRLLVTVLILFWRLKPRSAATLETGLAPRQPNFCSQEIFLSGTWSEDCRDIFAIVCSGRGRCKVQVQKVKVLLRIFFPIGIC